LDIIKEIPRETLILGSCDALSHCIESLYSFNSNPYSEFISIATINNFFNMFTTQSLLNTSNEITKNDIAQLCLTSFNGGIAQNNAGAGICHALAHATEAITGLEHAKCIAFFMPPTLEYLECRDECNTTMTQRAKRFFSEVMSLTNKNEKYDSIYDVISEVNSLKSLVELASKDPCWRLFAEKIDKEKLINCIKR